MAVPRAAADRPFASLGACALAALTMVSVFLAVNNLGSWLHIEAQGRVAEVDFVSLAVAGQLARTDGAALYDGAEQASLQRTFDPRADPALRPFSNPPFVATAARLLTSGGIDRGYIALSVANLALLGLLAALLLRTASTLSLSLSWKLALVSGFLGAVPVANAIAEGAISVFPAFGMALVLLGERHHRDPQRSRWPSALLDRHLRHADRLIAVGLVLLAGKPHLALAPVVVLLARRHYRPLCHAVTVGVAIVAASLWSPGPGAWLRYPAALLGAGDGDSAAAQHAAHWWNVASVISRFFPASMASALGWVTFVLGLTVLAVAARQPRWPLPLLMIGSLITIAHVNPHDAIWFPLAFALLWPQLSPIGGLRRAAIVGLALSWPLVSLLSVVYAKHGGSVVVVGLIAAFCGLAGSRRAGRAGRGSGEGVGAAGDAFDAALL